MYDRQGIEKIADWKFGDVRFSNETYLHDALTEEVVIVSYDYNSHQPRIFSKFASHRNNGTYNVSITDASEASSAAPIYFDPKVIGNQVLVDGGIIANEPALYSYLHAVYSLHKPDNIRMVSIGTG